MWATKFLRNEHSLLRAELTLLQAALTAPSADQRLIQRIVDSLAAQLHRHTRREERLLGALRLRQPDDAPGASTILADHQQQRRTVAALLELFLKSLIEDPDQSPECGLPLIDRLLDQLDHEEQAVFPAIDRCLCEGPVGGPDWHVVRAGPEEPVTTTMTVEQVLAAHPGDAAVFARFGVDAQADRAARLDSLGWRHGVHVPALLAALNRPATGLPSPPEDLLWNSCDGIMVIDEDRRILAMNRTLERWIGRPAEDVIGRRDCGLLFGCEDVAGGPVASREERCPGLRAIHRLQPVTNCEYTIRRADGARRLIHASYTPVREGLRAPVLAVAVLRDMGPAPTGDGEWAAHEFTSPCSSSVAP
jgi:PAS domain-containing protein